MSKKNERVAKLIALYNMLHHQKRDRDGRAKFNKEQLGAADQVILEVLKLDGIVPAGTQS